MQLTKVEARVRITEQVATTTLDMHLYNPGRRAQEAEVVVPVPAGASIRGFVFEGGAAAPTAELIAADQAKATYDSIVRTLKDPALLEFVGHALVRSSVFPVAGNGTQRVQLTYEELLVADGDRVDYVLPRSASLAVRVPWTVTITVQSKTDIATLYSPSHELGLHRIAAGHIVAKIANGNQLEAGGVRLSYLRVRGDRPTASLLAYPEGDGGYFLLLAGVPATAPAGQPVAAIQREVTLVLDRSGSMRGDKLSQAREAALQVIHGLQAGEYFNVIAYNNVVEQFAPAAVAKSALTVEAVQAYLQAVTAQGGTDIHAALTQALAPAPSTKTLPLVLFLTDGRATSGETGEVAIRELVTKHNTHARRVFTFGVGTDVNSPLLEALAEDSRATPTFVLPDEDVEVKVGQVFQRLVGPVMADPALQVTGAADAAPPMTRAHDLLPKRLPDLFAGQQLVLFGRYRGTAPLRFSLRGNFRGTPREFTFEFSMQKASRRNGFVKRLWASRQIGQLVEAIRRAGADSRAEAMQDPKLKELVDEIVRLSIEGGVLSEYTAFLALEGTDLSSKATVAAEAGKNFRERAMSARSGLGSVTQSFNNGKQKGQAWANGNNCYQDLNNNRVEIATVQQVNDRAFFYRGKRWVDSRLVEEKELTITRTIAFGSDAYLALVRTLAERGLAGAYSLGGDVVLLLDGERVLVQAPVAPAAPAPSSGFGGPNRK